MAADRNLSSLLWSVAGPLRGDYKQSEYGKVIPSFCEDVEICFKREIPPHAPDAWIDHGKTKTGYEIPFNRHFCVFHPPRPLAQIDAELKTVTDRILTMIGGLTQ